jgi:hypothetical protein
MISHDGFGPDLAFFYKEIKPGFCADGRRDWRGNEQTAHAEVTNAGNVMPSFTAPNDPNILGGFGARNHSSGIGQFCKCGCHESPLAVRAWAGPSETKDSTQGYGRG